MTALPARPFSAGDFPELDTLHTLTVRAGAAMRTRTLCEVTARGERLPVQAIELGSTSPQAPAVGFFGGVHGVERIGTWAKRRTDTMSRGREKRSAWSESRSKLAGAGC